MASSKALYSCAAWSSSSAFAVVDGVVTDGAPNLPRNAQSRADHPRVLGPTVAPGEAGGHAPPTDPRRIDQHAAGPAVDVELLDQASHAAHPIALLLRRHGEGQVQGGRRLLDVVGVHDERLDQFPCGSGEL